MIGYKLVFTEVESLIKFLYISFMCINTFLQSLSPGVPIPIPTLPNTPDLTIPVVREISPVRLEVCRRYKYNVYYFHENKLFFFTLILLPILWEDLWPQLHT